MESVGFTSKLPWARLGNLARGGLGDLDLAPPPPSAPPPPPFPFPRLLRAGLVEAAAAASPAASAAELIPDRPASGAADVRTPADLAGPDRGRDGGRAAGPDVTGLLDRPLRDTALVDGLGLRRPGGRVGIVPDPPPPRPRTKAGLISRGDRRPAGLGTRSSSPSGVGGASAELP